MHSASHTSSLPCMLRFKLKQGEDITILHTSIRIKQKKPYLLILQFHSCLQSYLHLTPITLNLGHHYFVTFFSIPCKPSWHAASWERAGAPWPMWPGQPDRLLPPGPEELEALLLPPALVLALGLSRVISPMEKGHLVTVHSTVTACSSLYYMVHCASARERARRSCSVFYILCQFTAPITW